MVEEKGRQTADKKKGRKPWTLREFGGQTLWDWLHLLSALAIPVVLAAAGLWFTAQQDQRQREIEDQRVKQAQKIETDRAEAERELAEQRAQDEALQAYLSQMSSLLLEKDLRDSKEDSEVRNLARARTLTVLGRLDSSRKADVMQFLVEADLVQRVDGKDPIIGLSGANLSGANLSEADLSYANLGEADLSEAHLSEAHLSEAHLRGANLSEAVLRYADLSGTNLSDAILREADLRSANLGGADLSDAILRGANLGDAIPGLSLHTNLHNANLIFANLSRADLNHAVLSRADLNHAALNHADLSFADLNHAVLSGTHLLEANLRKAEGITNEELQEQAASLEGATMPNGQKHEDWIKSKENGKNE